MSEEGFFAQKLDSPCDLCLYHPRVVLYTRQRGSPMSQKNTISSPMAEDRFLLSWHRTVAVSVMASALMAGSAVAQKAPEGREEFARYAQKLRETALMKLERMEPRVQLPTTGQRNAYSPAYARRDSGRYPWKTNIVTTVFWVGEKATARNPVANHASSWDKNWAKDRKSVV